MTCPTSGPLERRGVFCNPQKRPQKETKMITTESINLTDEQMAQWSAENANGNGFAHPCETMDEVGQDGDCIPCHHDGILVGYYDMMLDAVVKDANGPWCCTVVIENDY